MIFIAPPDGDIPGSIFQIVVKFLIPATVMVTVTLAIKIGVMNKRMPAFSIICSYVIGLGFGFVFGPAVYEVIPNKPLAFGAFGGMVMLCEQIGKYVIVRFDFEAFADSVVRWVVKKWFNGK